MVLHEKIFVEDTFFDLSKLTNSSSFLMKRKFAGCWMTCRRSMLLDGSSLDFLVWRQLFAAVATSLALKFLVVPTTFLWRLSPTGWSVPFKDCQEQTKLRWR